MKLAEVAKITGSRVVCGGELLDREVKYAFSSDLLSDVLTINKAGIMLITGLANAQTVRTAEMAEAVCVFLVRNKKADEDMIQLANDNSIVIMESRESMFGISGKLYQSGIKPLF